MTPEGWALVTAMAVALTGGATGIRAASIARKAQREAAKDSPYEAIEKRVMFLEDLTQQQGERIDALQQDLRAEKERSAHAAAAFRTRIQVLLRHIAALDEYAEMLVDLIRLHVTTVTTLPRKPELPPSQDDDL